jgi:hypothetical protein
MAAPTGTSVPAEIVHHDRPENVTDKAHLLPAGGEQAANALQQGSISREATTADAKVSGTIAASPLVRRRPCLRSHGRGRRFEALLCRLT